MGRLTWLIELAEAANAKVELYVFDITPEERWRRVRKRNDEKEPGVYHWTMSKDEFDAQGPLGELPAARPGLTIIKVT